MSTKTAEKKKISVKFHKLPGYEVLPATGVWNSMTADGQVLCNFIVETEVIPEEVIIEAGDGKINELKRTFPSGTKSGDFVKQLQVGIVMTPATAKAVGEWIAEYTKSQMIEQK